MGAPTREGVARGAGGARDAREGDEANVGEGLL